MVLGIARIWDVALTGSCPSSIAHFFVVLRGLEVVCNLVFVSITFRHRISKTLGCIVSGRITKLCLAPLRGLVSVVTKWLGQHYHSGLTPDTLLVAPTGLRRPLGITGIVLRKRLRLRQFPLRSCFSYSPQLRRPRLPMQVQLLQPSFVLFLVRNPVEAHATAGGQMFHRPTNPLMPQTMTSLRPRQTQ